MIFVLNKFLDDDPTNHSLDNMVLICLIVFLDEIPYGRMLTTRKC